MLAEAQLGPAWTAEGLDLARAPRYPLRVETHVQQLVDSLVPGITTVTPHARYLTLHGLCWSEAERRGLDLEPALELLRRAEVVVAGVAERHATHGGHDLDIGAAHGADAVRPATQPDAGVLDVEDRAAVGRYSQQRWGFGGTYYGSELRLGILNSGTPPQPGPRLDVSTVRAAMGAVVDVADESSVSLATLDSLVDCCICRAPRSPDGPWLQRLLCDPPLAQGYEKPDVARRDTVRLVAVMVRHKSPKGSLEAAFTNAVAFGGLLKEPDVAVIASAEPWRGVALRNFSVGAWRRLWAWLVDQLAEPMTRRQLGDRLANEMPAITVAQQLEQLPSLSENGELLPAEVEARSSTTIDPFEELNVLAIGALRLEQLAGKTLRAFAGGDDRVFSPGWVRQRLDASAIQSVGEFASELAVELADRAKRVALSKVRTDRTGTLWYPSRIVERDGLLIRRSREGSGDVGLRINALGQMLLSAGVLSLSTDRTWRVAAATAANV